MGTRTGTGDETNDDAEIKAIAKEREAGLSHAEPRRKPLIKGAPFGGRRSKRGGREVSDAKTLLALERERQAKEATRRRPAIRPKLDRSALALLCAPFGP